MSGPPPTLDAARYTDRGMEQISGAANPRTPLPAPPEAREVAREIADAVADLDRRSRPSGLTASGAWL